MSFFGVSPKSQSKKPRRKPAKKTTKSRRKGTEQRVDSRKTQRRQQGRTGQKSQDRNANREQSKTARDNRGRNPKRAQTSSRREKDKTTGPQSDNLKKQPRVVKQKPTEAKAETNPDQGLGSQTQKIWATSLAQKSETR